MKEFIITIILVLSFVYLSAGTFVAVKQVKEIENASIFTKN